MRVMRSGERDRHRENSVMVVVKSCMIRSALLVGEKLPIRARSRGPDSRPLIQVLHQIPQISQQLHRWNLITMKALLVLMASHKRGVEARMMLSEPHH
jgi:hypothetical protein